MRKYLLAIILIFLPVFAFSNEADQKDLEESKVTANKVEDPIDISKNDYEEDDDEEDEGGFLEYIDELSDKYEWIDAVEDWFEGEDDDEEDDEEDNDEDEEKENNDDKNNSDDELDEEHHDDYLDELQAGATVRVIGSKNPKKDVKNVSIFDFNPKVSYRTVTDIRFNDNYQFTNNKSEFKDANLTSRINSRIEFNKKLSLEYQLRVARANQALEDDRRGQHPEGGGDRTFEDLSLYLRELALVYDNRKYAILAGKLDIDFGTAWRWNRDIWAHDVADNYRLTEKLTVGGIYRLGDRQKTGQYNFGLFVYTNDRKNFDNSIITSRDSDTKADAKPGDTRGLESYLGTLDINFDFGERYGQKESLFYHFSVYNASVNSRATSINLGKLKDERGSSASMNYIYPFSDFYTLNFFAEYTDIKNVGGNSDISDRYTNITFLSKFDKKWLLTLANATRTNKEFGANGFNQDLSEVSFGYEFGKTSFYDKLTFQVGYKHERFDRKTSIDTRNTYGALLRIYKNF